MAMGLSVDAEFLSALKPFLEGQAQVEKPQLHDVAARRARYDAIGGQVPIIPESVVFETLMIRQEEGPGLRVYHLKPQNISSSTAAAVHFHGGGLISCTPDIATERLASYVRDTGVQIFSVDYRLAPEHRYPAALDDGWFTLAWVHENAPQLLVDRTRIAVMGDSAGGGLAAALSIRARDEQLSPPIARQILCSPMLDDRTTGDVPGDFKLWDAEDNLTAWTAYLGESPGGNEVPATAAPARVAEVEGLPPLYLDTSQFDLFVKENLDWVRRFVEAGVEVECHVSPGLPHGFDSLLPSHRVTLEYEEHRKRNLRML
ncbi:hypothetical protein CkaCkLH20_11680 [Colletotrichum karsti]|uniref:Alpha/beta hydrolase fold-3 domain-containing protein n=1 Tax=Colletotrichum karsti TaxID=1095194 RepID=A0A9P6LF37_9PEZI|nr:uncharacterized protein CkaCkLH20_11680 [Colletotrichum karsti]KAF9870781.1 hypothetical protein CkaCkLH20_11680 [Colletotrichum karsti]